MYFLHVHLYWKRFSHDSSNKINPKHYCSPKECCYLDHSGFFFNNNTIDKTSPQENEKTWKFLSILQNASEAHYTIRDLFSNLPLFMLLSSLLHSCWRSFKSVLHHATSNTLEKYQILVHILVQFVAKKNKSEMKQTNAHVSTYFHFQADRIFQGSFTGIKYTACKYLYHEFSDRAIVHQAGGRRIRLGSAFPAQ